MIFFSFYPKDVDINSPTSCLRVSYWHLALINERTPGEMSDEAADDLIHS